MSKYTRSHTHEHIRVASDKAMQRAMTKCNEFSLLVCMCCSRCDEIKLIAQMHVHPFQGQKSPCNVNHFKG